MYDPRTFDGTQRCPVCYVHYGTVEHVAACQSQSIHDEEVNFARERVASSWVLRAQAGELPAKEYAR